MKTTRQSSLCQPDVPNTIQSWEQQPTETSGSYATFLCYLELGLGRKLKSVTESTGRSLAAISSLCTRHQWKERANAYDEHLERIRQRAKEEVLEERGRQDAQVWVQRTYQKRERLWAVSEQLIERAEEMLTTPLDDMRWSPRDIATLSDLAIRMTQHIEQSLPAQAGDTDDEVEVLVRYVGQ